MRRPALQTWWRDFTQHLVFFESVTPELGSLARRERCIGNSTWPWLPSQGDMKSGGSTLYAAAL